MRSNSTLTARADQGAWPRIWQVGINAAERRAGFILPLPAVLVTIVLIGLPSLALLYLSLNDWFLQGSTAPAWVGLANYKALLSDSRFLNSLWRTGYFSGLALVVEVPLGLLIALLLNREFPGRSIIRTLFLFPMVATPVAMALIWVMMLDPTFGVINYYLGLIGLHGLTWVSSERWVIPSLVMVDAWEWTPMVALITLAGLAALPAEPYEAATVDGANAWHRFWLITLPLLRPTIVVAALFRLIDLLKTIDIIYVMTRGGPGFASETTNIYNFLVGLFYFRVGYASAIAVIIFALVLGISLMVLQIRRPSWE